MLEVISGRAPVVIEEGASLRREQRDIDRPAMPCRSFHVHDQLGTSSAFRRRVRHLRLRRLDAGRSIPFVHVLASKDWDISVIARMTDVACPDVWAIQNSFFFSDAWPPALSASIVAPVCSCDRLRLLGPIFLQSWPTVRLRPTLSVVLGCIRAVSSRPTAAQVCLGHLSLWDHSFGST